MPAPFVIQSITPDKGMRKVLLALNLGQTNYVHFHVTSEVLAGIFGDDVREGESGTLSWEMLKRPGTNGPSP